ncbi:MAG TPA: hypothetical protein VFM84_01040, partial [Holophagaceae bacterium]|nr:hypothetical protein [Holophagaceae bacterium]
MTRIHAKGRPVLFADIRAIRGYEFFSAPTNSKNAFAAWLNGRFATDTRKIFLSKRSSFTCTSFNTPCLTSWSTHIRGRKATPSPACTMRRMLSTV